MIKLATPFFCPGASLAKFGRIPPNSFFSDIGMGRLKIIKSRQNSFA
jgi:hypothetical protein